MRSAESTAEVSRPSGWDLVGRQLGRYELLHLLASGGMGSVFVGRARGAGGFERLVAIKVLHRNRSGEEEFISMFLDEARLAAQIHHPNVVATLDVASDGSDHYLVMEYVAGVHLGGLARLARRIQEPIPVPITVRIALDVLAGLAASHSLKAADGSFLNLIHRDVSPVNILVGVDGIARLTDFGIAKAEARLTSTRKGEFKGKLSYAAPEQLSARDQTDQRSDLFSMGVVLFEALANRRLFEGSESSSIVQRLLIEPIPRVSSVRPELKAFDPFLERALQRDPALRFTTADEMSAALQEATLQFNFEGAANHATVGAYVEKAAAKKLAAERAAIQKGRLSFAATQPEPLTGDESLPPTVLSPPPTYIRKRLGLRKRWIVGAAVGLALLGIGATIAVTSWSGAPSASAANEKPHDRTPAAHRAAKRAAVASTPRVDTPPVDPVPAEPQPGDEQQTQGQQAEPATPNGAAGTHARAGRSGRVRERPVRGGVRAPATPPPAPSNPYE